VGAELSGFKRVIRENVRVQANQVVDVKMTLLHLAVSVHRMRPSASPYSVGTASASRRNVLSRLNTGPPVPVNASASPSRAALHDSGPVWVANPSPYDSFIHNTSPV
jgi:hypothetical protein